MRQVNHEHVIAADIGGTHITAAVVNTADWSINQDSLVRNPVDSSASAKSILQAWSETFKATREVAGGEPLSVGIAMPGPFDYENGISLIKDQSKYDALYQLNVKQELAELLGIEMQDIRLINDAAAFLQGEVYVGGLNHSDKVLGITLGTGLGSAIWEKGGNAADADLWKLPYRESIMEEYLVTRWFVRSAECAGLKVSGLRELLQLRGEHAVVEEILNEYSQHLLYFINYFSEQEHTDKFVLGGNIARAWPIFRSFSPEEFNRFDIHLSQLGEDAALIGAAAAFVR